MNNRKRKEAIRETFAFSGEMFESERNQQSGLRLKTTRMSRTCGLSRIGGNGYLCAMMLKPSRMRRCRGRSLLELRRMTAAPSITHARGVFFRAHGNELPKLARFGGIRKHGLIASTDFMGAPCGELSGSPFPKLRYFLHPHGAARPVGRADGFDNLSIGATAMTLHDAASVHAHAHTVGASSLRAFLSILSCGNIRLPARMSGCGFSRPLNIRRISAAPRFYARGFSFGPIPFTGEGAPACVIRYPGRIAPTDFVMGTPGGKPSGLPFPDVRSANPPGVARPLAGVCGSNNSTSGNSAMTHHDAASVHAHAHTIGASSLRSFLSILSCGNIRLPARMSGCRLGGLLKARRITAAPRLYARGFSFGAIPCTGSNAPARGIRYPGRIALNDFMMSAPGGEPSGSPLPCLRSANLPGVALLLAGECDSNNSKQGNPGMNLHVTEGAPSRALNLGVCKLLNLINRLTGRAGGVRPRGSYPGVDLGMHIPSIFELNPELLELAHAEALKHSQGVRHE